MNDIIRPDLPEVIGLRGACAYAPENTLASIHTAADMGISWISLNVKLTKDSVPVVYGRDPLDDLTTGHGLIKNRTYDEIKALDAGSHFAESFYGEPIPTLEKALDIITEHGLGLNLEVIPSEGAEEDTAEAAFDMISRIWDDPRTLLINSNKAECLDVANFYLEDFARGLILEEPMKDWEELTERLGVSAITMPDIQELANEFSIKQFSNKDLAVLVHVDDDEGRASELLSLGASSIIMASPDLL